MKRVCLWIAALMVLAGSSGVLAQAGSTRIPGELVRLEGNRLALRTPSGEVLDVGIGATLRVLLVSQTTVAAIKPNDYLAVTAAAQPDGTLLARRVSIFPDSMRGAGEGHRPWTDGNTMTNATVAQVGGANTMTNATVANVSGSGVRSVMLEYKGGAKQALIPADLPITLLEQADRAVLVPGAKLIVVALRGGDGAWTTTSVQVGKNGSVPAPLN